MSNSATLLVTTFKPEIINRGNIALRTVALEDPIRLTVAPICTPLSKVDEASFIEVESGPEINPKKNYFCPLCLICSKKICELTALDYEFRQRLCQANIPVAYVLKNGILSHKFSEINGFINRYT